MSRSEYVANINGFTCVNMQRKAVAKKAEGLNIFHILSAVVCGIMLAGYFF